MSDNLMAYEVARIRTAEMSLLTAQFLEQLIGAKSYGEAVRLLSDKGWGDGDQNIPLPTLLKNERARTWNFLGELTENTAEFDVFLLSNDYHNLKTAIKLAYTGMAGENYYLDEGTVPLATIKQAVATRDPSLLPGNMGVLMTEATQTLAQTENGQLCDMMIDRAALEAIYDAAKKSTCEVIRHFGEITVAAANLKVAVRCGATGKSADFIAGALATCDSLDNSDLTAAALKGVDAIAEYLGKTVYERGAEELRKSVSAFERWCDNLLIQSIRGQRHNPFTMAPLAAYALAKENEIKSVRIVLSGKLNHFPEESIRERVREMYV